MFNFIIMTVITVMFGALLFYAIFKSTNNALQAPCNDRIRECFPDKYNLIFPEKYAENVFISVAALEKFKNTDGFYKLSEYYGLNLVRRVYTIENEDDVIANVFLYKNNIAASFLSGSDLA